jgi:hypothetical protein
MIFQRKDGLNVPVYIGAFGARPNISFNRCRPGKKADDAAPGLT